MSLTKSLLLICIALSSTWYYSIILFLFYCFSPPLKYNKFPTYEPSSCELSKSQMCVCISNLVSKFICLAYIVTCVHPLQVVVLLCTLQCCIEYSSIVYLFKAQYVQSKCKSSGCVRWVPGLTLLDLRTDWT